MQSGIDKGLPICVAKNNSRIKNNVFDFGMLHYVSKVCINLMTLEMFLLLFRALPSVPVFF